MKGIDDQWQADLVDMMKWKKQNNDYQYILTIIDCFSKYAWAVPIKTKSGKDIVEAFNNVFKERIPKKIQTDAGTEFIGKKTQALFEKLGIHWFATFNEAKASIVERFNRTLKTKMWRYFSEMGNKIWIKVLEDLMKNYNTSFHRSIKMTPVEGSDKKNENMVYYNLYGMANKHSEKPKFKIGDTVRIAKWKHMLHKGYLSNWTEEIFTISQVLYTEPLTYKIKDWNGEDVQGSFYEYELTKFNKQDDKYEVEKIIKSRITKGIKEYLVLWRGYPKSMATWIPAENLSFQ